MEAVWSMDLYLGFDGEPRAWAWKATANMPRLRELMAASKIDAVVGSSPLNVGYLANLDNPSRQMGVYQFVLAGADETTPVFVVLPMFELADFIEFAPPASVPIIYMPWGYWAAPVGYVPPQLSDVEARYAQILREVPCHENALDGLVAAIREAGLERARVGVETLGVTLDFVEALRQALPACHIVEGDGVLRQTRAVKTPAEIELLRSASAINSAALEVARKTIVPGVTEETVATAYRAAVVARGARSEWAVTKFGTETTLSHRRATRYQAKTGDLVRLEVGCTWSRYYSDMARNYVVGEASDWQERCYHALKAGQQRAVEVLRPGAVASDIFAAVVDTVRREGLPQFAPLWIAHGCGAHLYDAPLIGAEDRTSIEKSMVLAVECPYKEPGAGWNVEDEVLVTDSGGERLTDLPTKELGLAC